MIQLYIFLFLTILLAATSIGVLISGILILIARLRNKHNKKLLVRLRRMAFAFAVILILNISLVVVSQITAFTPPIVDASGNVRAGSIAELTQVELNGRKQWISIRGWDQSRPVLLFLAGGPGGTQMSAVRYELAELEKHFVVVNWDQPGAGKSYYAEKTKNITVETYIQDGYALTEYLKDRFGLDKIYMVGESWGSALGVFLVDRFPSSYHALIGTAQMIDFAETERIDYARAVELATNKGDDAVVQRLVKNGPPLYYGKDVTWKSGAYLNYLSAHMANNAAITDPNYNTIRNIGASEYGLLDKVNYARGVINTFNQVYQQLYEIDFRSDYTKLDVPVYFFLGRHDENAPHELVEEYVEVLDAPKKEIVWFEHSGHSPWINERDKFAQCVITYFLEMKAED